MKKLLILNIFILVFNLNKANSQCINQVTHLTDTMSVNGINVSVTSTGLVDNLTTYCSNSTSPYLIGYKYGIGSGNGSYVFNFSPAVNGLSINLSGISNSSHGVEVISIYLNGSHYSIPFTGIQHSCEPLALLTANGDITAPYPLDLTGWDNTSISGQIASIEIRDSVTNEGGGTIFSLFICDIFSSVYEIENQMMTSIYPNPISNELNIVVNNNEQLEFVLYDISSRKLLQQRFINKATIDTEQLAKGIYLYEVRSRNQIIKNGKVIKE